MIMTVFYNCTIGCLRIVLRDGFVEEVDLADRQQPSAPQTGASEVTRQLDEYFAGLRRRFDLPLRPAGTPFQQRVYAELLKIPYGQTVTYADMARAIGQPKACQAVGQAVGRNPIMILIPCHRVVASGGRIGGFSGGIPTKLHLLQLEMQAAFQ